LQTTEQTRIRTHPERAVPDEAEDILERGTVAHIGIVVDGRAVIIPMGYHYENGTVYVHGQRQGRLPRTLRAGDQVCVEVTLLDGLVASRDALYHSMNYRSAVAFGRAHSVVDDVEKAAVLERMTRRYFPGRTIGEHYDGPSAADLKITDLLAIEIEEINGKRRSGPPAGPRDRDPEAAGTAGIFPVPDGLG
jgi:nitroimidazol reductase NimA-like FMN-containing flavoprotein (pyridoxamine 5'-phosphate oxidase superfamily)